jgi:hypothetical protein
MNSSAFFQFLRFCALAVALSLLLTLTVNAQATQEREPQHVALLGTYQFSDGRDGNGAAVGCIVQGAMDLQWQKLQLAGTAQFSSDLKVYRHQTGGAARVRLNMRKYFKHFFAQGGLYTGGIYFADLPNSNDGYVKYLVRPLVGGGVHFGDKNFSATAQYGYHVNGKLYARDNELTRASRTIDGWSEAHWVGVSTFTRLNEKWFLAVNAGWNRSAYRRNPAVYGQELGSVTHVSHAYDFAVGVGYRFPNR